MRSNYKDLPALRSRPKTLEAATYNRVRLALRRLGNPLRVALPRHRGLEAVLGDEAWCVVDTLNDDQLILAWCEFQTRRRRALHEPVTCRLRLYHNHAGLIMGTALEALMSTLSERLEPEPIDNRVAVREAFKDHERDKRRPHPTGGRR